MKYSLSALQAMSGRPPQRPRNRPGDLLNVKASWSVVRGGRSYPHTYDQSAEAVTADLPPGILGGDSSADTAAADVTPAAPTLEDAARQAEVLAESLPIAQQRSLLLSSTSLVHVLHVSQDRAEAHLLIPAINQRTGAQEGFGFLGLREVQFQETEPVLVSWCSNSSCSAPTGLGCIYQGQHYPGVPKGAHLTDQPPLCPCAQALLDVQGPGWLADVLTSCQAAPLRSSVVHLQIQGSQHSAVCTSSDFEDWGLLQHKVSQTKCLTCSRQKHQCPHVKAWRGSASDAEDNEGDQADSSVTLPAAQWEEHLARFVSNQSGEQILHCISRQHIPETVDQDPAVAAALKGVYHPAQLACST